MQPDLHPDDYPNSLAKPDVRGRRSAMLGGTHVAPLNEYVRRLRETAPAYIPDFDPLDGGVEAEVLFLFGAPGPGTIPGVGSGFVSRNNNDRSASAAWHFFQKTGIPRRGTLSWNVSPWVLSKDAGVAKWRAGAATLPALLDLLPRLRSVVMIGNQARDFGRPHLTNSGIRLFESVQTGLQAQHGPDSKDRWPRIPEIWKEAWEATSRRMS